MKARNNKTGEIVSNFAISEQFGTISYFDSTKTLRFANPCDGEWTIIEEETIFDWQSFRAEAAKDILCAMLTDQRISETTPYKELVKRSLECTDELIKQLKEQTNEIQR